MTPVVEAIETARVTMRASSDLVVRGAKGAHDVSDFLLVRVRGSGGVEGYGEVSATPLWSGEDGETARHFIADVLAPTLIGRPLAPVGALEARMDRVLAGNPFTKAGVSIALWDAFARTAALPLVTVLGGPYREEIPIKLSLSGDDDQLARAHRAATAAGFGAFKVKVGLDPAGDVARFARVRQLAGPDTPLGADANGGWSRAQARETIPALVKHGLAFMEQPVAAADLDGMRSLRDLGVPVVVDESVFGLDDLVRVIRAEAADVVSVYVGKCGGPGRAVQLARVAEAFGLDVLIGSNGELGVGAAAQLHVAAALPALSAFPSDIIGAHYYDDDVLATPLDSDGRRVRLGPDPGLGVAVREDLLKEFG
jgi:L-alanine-DL-glutamate epimerase-like enolase superfamily enzyme